MLSPACRTRLFPRRSPFGHSACGQPKIPARRRKKALAILSEICYDERAVNKCYHPPHSRANLTERNRQP